MTQLQLLAELVEDVARPGPHVEKLNGIKSTGFP
jgi:hypothetical protein